MNIAFLTTYDFAVPGGVRNHIYHLAQELSRLGHKTYILAPSSKPLDIKGFVPLANFPSATKTWFIPPHLLVGFTAVRNLKTFLKTTELDILHIHEPLIPPLCLASLFLRNTPPLFATFHTYYELGQPMYRLFRPLFYYLLKKLRGRITVSNSAKNYIAQYFPYDYAVIPNGVNIKTFAKPSILPPILSAEFLNILFIGHAQFKRKGLRYLLEAYNLLKPHYPQLRLIVAGAKWSGRKQPQTNFSKDVLYLDTVNDETLIKLYQTADIFCAPSTGNESFGIVLIEAMAAGIPIVTTNIQGYMNVVSDNQEALLVPPRNSQALADALEILINNPKLCQKLVVKAKERVQKFDWEHVTKQVIQYYNSKISA